MEATTWKYDPRAIGRRIEQRLKETKLRKGDFARLVGRDSTRVSKWLRGEELNKIEVIGKIAEVLDCAVDYLIGRTQEDISMVEFSLKQRKSYELIFEIKALLPSLDEVAIDHIIATVDFWKKHTKGKETNEC